jgi:tetratricopeptide (TPR) repeat protein
VAVNADGRRAVSASGDNTLKVWDLESGREVRSLQGHAGPVYGVAVSADGRRAVSASEDKTLKMWDLESRHEVRSLQGHVGPVWGVAVTADGRRAVSASGDKTLKMWDLTDRSRESLIEVFAKALKETLQKELGQPSGSTSDIQLPFLIVFDTFEEVQYAGKTPELELGHFFLDLRRNYRNVRAVVSGRAYPAELKTVVDTPPIDIEIKEFDEDSANAYLKNLGVDQADFRKRLFEQVGGNPLSLKLAAEVFLREGGDEKGIRDLKTTNWLILGVSEAKIQGQLYERILGHLHGDPDLKALAHPGLVLRRITPEIIQEVLQGPCKISVPTPQRAQELFGAFQREVSLVEVAEDGSLHHRPDVRRLMLGDLKRDKYPQMAEIEEAAVAYYSNQPGLVARAEEIYHRLRRCEKEETIEQRWLPGVEPYLRGALVDSGGAAVEELGAEQRLYLSRKLGVPVAGKLRTDADLESWERYAAAHARTRLRSGYFDEALKLLRERRDRTARSALHLCEAKALFGMGLYDEAEEILTKAFNSESSAGDLAGQLQCALLGAMLSEKLGRPVDADGYLETAEALAGKAEDRVRLVQILLYRMELQKNAEPRIQDALRRRIASAVGKLTLGEGISNESLVRSATGPDPVFREYFEKGLLSDMPAATQASATTEKFEGFLTRAMLSRLVDAAVNLGLTDPGMRNGLFAGIGAGLLARLPNVGAPWVQLRVDLNELNTLQFLPDGSVPMLTWLQNAMTLLPEARQSAVFKTALDQVRAATGQYDSE